MNEPNIENQAKLIDAIGDFFKPKTKQKARMEFANKNMMQTLFRHQVPPTYESTPREFMPQGNEAHQMRVVMNYLALATMADSFKQVEYYFRRYPFHDLPVTHADHLKNICEMYFDRTYQFKERLKSSVNALQAYSNKKEEIFGEVIRAYNRTFDWEIRMRNSSHHKQKFEYDGIDQLGLIHLLKKSDQFQWLPEPKYIYRAETKKWADRVKSRSQILDHILEIVAARILENCDFLKR